MAFLASLEHLPENNTDNGKNQTSCWALVQSAFVLYILPETTDFEVPTIKWTTKKDKAVCSPFLGQHQL